MPSSATSSKVYLNVPFAAKDRAKGLGARWDPLVRRWYVSEHAPIQAFLEWLPPESPAAGFDSRVVPAEFPDSSERGLALAAFLAEVSAAISLRVPRSQWVRAEISQLRLINGGHTALELVEHDESGRLIARVQAFVWSQRSAGVLRKFTDETGAELAVGLKVLLQMSAEFSTTYGLRVVIEDIDPAYTLGDIDAKVKAIRDALVREGLFELNRSLPEPAEFCHVAVVSPKDAAGLGDFRRDADRLHAANLCQFDYYTASFQGNAAPASLIEALERVVHDYQHGCRFDALCLIRGGGSVTDLYWLNDLDLARALCRVPMPVITGIGHERDNTILDELSRHRCDTPSKVIAWISNVIIGNATAAIEDMLSIAQSAGAAVASRLQRIDALKLQIEEIARRTVLRAEHDVERWADQTHHLAAARIQAATHALMLCLSEIRGLALSEIADMSQSADSLWSMVELQSGQTVTQAEIALDSLAREVLGLGPRATLERGFALVRDRAGGVVSSASTAERERFLSIEFRDGNVAVTVADPLEEEDQS